jgi:two-component system chemotaxis sensor kinase CheA
MAETHDIPADLMAGFLEEAPTYLTALEEGLMVFESQAQDGAIALRGADDHERMNEVFRAAHSLKGVAASLGFQRIRDLTHLMESLFDQLRCGVRELYANEVEALFGAVDTLRKLVDELQHTPDEPVSIDQPLATLAAMLEATPAAKPAATAASAPAAAPAAAAVAAPLPAAPSAPVQQVCASRVIPAMTGTDPELMQRFIEATVETIEEVDQRLLELEKSPQDAEIINDIFRAAHNIKGASGAVHCEAMHRLTHDMESVLDRARAGEVAVDTAMFAALFAAADRLKAYLEIVRKDDGSGFDVSGDQAIFEAWLAPTSTAGGATAAAPPPPSQIAGGSADDDNVVVVSVTFAEDFSEATIYACMIYNRLADIGEMIGADPDVFNLDGDAHVTSVVYRLTTDADAESIERVVRAYNVQTVTVRAPRHADVDADEPVARASAPTATVAAAHVPDDAAEHEDALPAVAGTAAAAGPPKPSAASGEAAPAKAGETIRVDLERLDQLMNLGGELVITKARFVEIARNLGGLFARNNLGYLVDDVGDRIERLRSDVEAMQSGGDARCSLQDMADATLHLSHDFATVRSLVHRIQESRGTMTSFSEAVHSLNRISEGIQKRIMQTRMVAIGPLFQRFRRVTRDLCKTTGKRLDLVLRGEATELDKRMIDELVDPLTHMIRNSVDHGIELPADRLAAGKPETGQVVLDAFHRGRHICIEVRDDGRGISAERIKAKILERELATQAQVDQMSDHEAYQYVFRPGFSTAEKVTDLSGRGMGMDIVRTKIESINGAVTLSSTPGVGTTFTIQLPLTLAIINAMMARVGTTAYAVPLEMVVEIIPVARDRVQHIQGQAVIRLRDHVIPLALLEETLSLPHGEQRTATRDDDFFTVLILGAGRDRLGLVVDELLGQEDIVIKDIAANFHNVEGVAGASIMGDGSVSLILDVASLMTRFSRRGATRSWLAEAVATSPQYVEDPLTAALVGDHQEATA